MKAIIISNPASGSFNENLLKECAEIYKKRYGDIDIELTQHAGHAGKIASETDADIVIAAGGDGLINEVVGGLDGKDKIFSALPFGTRNVFCREFDIPLNPIKAVNKLNIDNIIKLPVGYVGSRPFILMCGFGYDAEVVKNVVTKKYTKNKTWAHIKEGGAALYKNYPKLTLYMNNKMIPAYHVIISLVRKYAGSFKLSKEIEENSLNVFILQQNGAFQLLKTSLSMAFGRGFPQRSLQTDALKVVGTNYVQVDGEFLDTDNIQNYINLKKSALIVAL